MIPNSKILTISNKLKARKLNRGMTYVELIVVLSIFAVISSVVMFNYGDFQSRIDIKNLASDIALKIVQAQKDALSGKLNDHDHGITGWKPAYGVYFSTVSSGLADSTSFDYFTDKSNNNSYNDSSCDPSDLSGECLDKIVITKGNSISSIDVFYRDGSSVVASNLAIFFSRPSSSAVLRSATGLDYSNISYGQITVISPKNITAKIKVYVSGRIQVN